MKRLLGFMVVGTALLTLVPVAWASGEAVHYDWSNLAWRTLNFLFFAGILWWAGGKKLIAFLRGRRDHIAHELDDLSHMQVKAQSNLDELARRMANVEAERMEIIEESRRQAESITAALIADAQAQAAQILEQARRTAENDARNMLEQVRLQVADEVAAAVEVALTSQLDAAGHDRLIDNALKKVVFQ